ncbi:MAG: AMP-binding protein, partial [Chloroflexi bacterium]|nr:AMP-binding protein [Chloroflexota bacterium]
MNILLASTSPYRDNFTGANKINRLIVELLAAKGHQCAVLALQKPLAALPVAEGSPPGTGTQAQIEVSALNGVQVHAADIAHPGQLPALRATLQDLIRDTSPDIVLISSEDWGQFLLEAAVAAAPGRVVYLAHTPIALPFGPDSIMPNPAGTALMQKTAAVIALSHFLADYIFEWSGIKAHTIYPPAYGDGPFPFHRASNGYVTLVNPCTVKGISIFLELARRLPDVQFAAVLTWGTTEADQRAMEALPNITLLQPTEDIDTFLSSTSVMLVPSLWNEAFGLIVVDALLRGIPVLASKIGGLPEAKIGTNFQLPVQPITRYELNQGLTLAREVPDQDIQPWLAALTSLLEDQELHSREAQLSRDAAHAFLSSLGIEQYEQIFEDVVAKAPAKQSPGDDSRKAEARVRDLSSDRRALLELLRKEKREAQRRQDTIPAYAREDGDAPLSLAQQRLWVVEQLTPGTALYTIPFVARLHGPFDVAALRHTLDTLVARHEPLRTVFHLRDGEPRQHILPPAPVPLTRVDLTALPAATRAATADALVTAAVQQPFDVATGPLFRAALLRETPTSQRLVLTVHHLVCDGWSWGIFIREFAALYHQFAGGPPAALPPLPIQYADFAAWQRQRLHADALEQQLAYWRTQLADAPRLLELPTDFPRPATPALTGDLVAAHVPVALAAQLRALSQGHGASLYMTLLAAFAALLARLSHQDDLVIGTPVAGRARAELTPLIGFFVNTVALRLRDLHQLTGAALIEQTRTVVLDAFAHQELPFEQVVEAVAPTRVLSHAPLVQVVFTLQSEPLQEHRAGTFVLQPETVGTATAKFDLTLTAVELLDGALSLTAEYRTDLFRPATIQRLLSQYAVLLAGLVAAPEQPIATLPLLPDHERAHLLDTWNATDRPYPALSVPALVAQHADRNPKAVALIAGAGTRERVTLTYAELVARANQLAHRLQAEGVHHSARVGVYLERGAELVITLLGVLSAGAAYVPLDVNYPQERIALMLADAAVPLVVTSSALVDRLPSDVRRLCLDRVDLATEPTTPPAVALDPDDLAYVIYTSGSTGRPKGVAVPHRAIVRLVFGNDYTYFDDQRTFLLLAPISFDASTFELWGALLHGARCVLYPEGKPDISEIGSIIRDEGVTTLWLTASLFNLIVDEAVDILAPVKEVVTGGEALSPSHIRRAQSALPNTQLVNGYGPTETTTFACCYRIPRAFNPEDLSIPIGSPIGNTT